MIRWQNVCIFTLSAQQRFNMTYSSSHQSSWFFISLQGLVGTSYVHNHRGEHMASHTHTQTWEVWEAARLWALRGHMMVGGRFEKAYLRIDRAADCSCAEMIYISRNTHAHTFWSLHTETCACVRETHVHVIAVELHMTRILNCKIDLHICLWQKTEWCK